MSKHCTCTELVGISGNWGKLRAVCIIAVTNHLKFLCWLSIAAAPVCVVTGGSRGIGKAIALALGATGAKVNKTPQHNTFI